MKYRFEVMLNGNIIGQGNVVATHPIQILNSLFLRYNNANRLNLMNSNGERWVYIKNGLNINKNKSYHEFLNSGEVELVFNGEPIFSNMWNYKNGRN